MKTQLCRRQSMKRLKNKNRLSDEAVIIYLS